MAYSINGKIYTEHPLMDEMVYNLDIIMKNIEIKNETFASDYETESSLANSDTYVSIKGGTSSFLTFPFDQKMLIAYGYTSVAAYNYALDRTLIPEEDRDDVYEFCVNYFLENYVEENNYYRALLGLPWITEDESEDYNYVYIDESYISEPTLVDQFDFDLPVHEFTDYQIAILIALGVMDTLYEEYTGKRYKYLHFLGETKRDLFTVRSAAEFDILYMPSVETLVSDRFKELYQINRTTFLHRFYSEAYQVASEYYDNFVIIFLLCQTYTDMIADIPEWYVRRDIFDLRSCEYFLESHGIEFFNIIPLKYQINIVKNMNKLIRYKSTNKNIWDIIDLFDVDNVTVYKYYIFKKRTVNIKGSYATGLDPSDEYILEFVKAPIGDTYDNTIKDNIYRETYDYITLQDKYWDGQDDHATVYQWHIEKDFTIEGTKFISIEDKISMYDYQQQIQYFVGMILCSNLDMSDIKISIPSISALVSFSLSNLFIFLYCLTASYDGYSMLITTPADKEVAKTKPFPEYTEYDDYDGGYVSNGGNGTQYKGYDIKRRKYYPTGLNMNGGGDPEYSFTNSDSHANWLSRHYSYLWMDLSGRVYGYNLTADLDWLEEQISFRHSTYQFERGYTLEELGVDGFMTATSVSSVDEMIEIYKNNQAIYDNLKDKISSACSRDERVVLEFVFNYLFTTPYDYDAYRLSSGELATSYDQILKDRDYVLWKYYNDIVTNSDTSYRQDMILQTMNDVIATLEYYLNDDAISDIFAIFKTTSFHSMLTYIYLMINFFRSFKVYFLDPYVTYVSDDKVENGVIKNDQIGELKTGTIKTDRLYEDDTVSVTSELNPVDRSQPTNVEIIDLYKHYEPDPTFDSDVDGGDPETEYDSIADDTTTLTATLTVVCDDTDFGDQGTDTIATVAEYDYDFNDSPASNEQYADFDYGDDSETVVVSVGDILIASASEDSTNYTLTLVPSTAYMGFYSQASISPSPASVSYSSSNKSVATINSGGVISCYSEGTTTITAIVSESNGSVTIDESMEDGGRPSFISCIPFYGLNGGYEGKGKAMFDLEGGNVYDKITPVDIDGTYAHPEPEEHLMADIAYHYSVDGGHVSKFLTMTPSMIVRVVDKQISADARIVPNVGAYTNPIERRVDGIYLEDVYITEAEYENCVVAMSEIIESYSGVYNDLIEKIELIYDQAEYWSTIVVVDYFKTAVENYKMVNGGLLESNNDYADEKAAELDSYIQKLYEEIAFSTF